MNAIRRQGGKGNITLSGISGAAGKSKNSRRVWHPRAYSIADHRDTMAYAVGRGIKIARRNCGMPAQLFSL